MPFAGRGDRFDAMLDTMTRVWAGEEQGFAGPIGPAAGIRRSQIIFGGGSARTFERVAARGAGWIAGSRGPDAFRQGADRVQRAWREHGREGEPRLMALPYFCLGPRAEEQARAFLSDHYAIEGDGAERVFTSALTSAEAVRTTVDAYERAGCDELMIFPCDPDPRQVELLADAARSGGP